MFAVGIKNNNDVKIIVNQRIWHGYKLSDWFWIFVKPIYNGTKLKECDSYIEFTLPRSKETILEKIKVKDELYKHHLKFTLSPYSKITNEPGIVKAKVIFKKNEEIVRTSSEFSFKISTRHRWHNDTDITYSDNNSNQSNCNCDSEEHLQEILEKTKPLMFDSVSDAESKINSGTVENIYCGQSVLINEDGKYILYTIQKENNRYIVEPVDTMGDGIFWNE